MEANTAGARFCPAIIRTASIVRSRAFGQRFDAEEFLQMHEYFVVGGMPFDPDHILQPRRR